MKPALVLVDLQNDYLRFPASGDLLHRVAALVRRCRANAIPVIHVWTSVQRDPDRRMPHWKTADKWICVEGAPGHASPVPPLPGEPIVHKTFFSAFGDGRLDAVLAQLGIDTLWLAGVQMQSCIRATALDAYQRGFQVVLQHDAIGTEDPLHSAISRRYLEARLGSPAVIDVSASTLTARQAWLDWRHTSLDTRVEVLHRFLARLDVAELTELVATTVHKAVPFARAEVERALALVKLAARPEPLEFPCGANSTMRYQPRGVIALVTPWNNPVAIPLGKIAPALLYGNTIVWKPSPLAGTIADRLAELIEPRGLVNVIHGDSAVAEQLMADEQVDAVTLTGGETAGYAAQVICARRHVPLQAELGGNNAAIVWSDADLPAAAAAIAEGAFGFAGQRCTANRRVIVERACLDEFVDQLQRTAVDPGRMISPMKCAQVAAVVARAGDIVFQGPPRDDPHYFPATVLRCDDPSAEIVQEETFGPVLVVQPADDFDHALRLCNGVRQGLVAALFSRSPERQQQFLADAQAGILKLNRATADADAEAPFGGWKASGIGPPEHGRSNREVYTRTQAVYS